jgi:hypothetical protein
LDGAVVVAVTDVQPAGTFRTAGGKANPWTGRLLLILLILRHDQISARTDLI